MGRKPDSPWHLPGATVDYKALLQEVDRFFALGPVQRALRDDAYRLGGFCTETTESGGQTYRSLAEQYYGKCHDTQWAFVDRNQARGILALNRRLEHLELLTNLRRGEGFVSDLHFLPDDNAIEIFDPPLRDSTKNLQLCYALAVECVLKITTGQLTDEPDIPVTITHGLHCGVTRGGSLKGGPCITGLSDDDWREVFRNEVVRFVRGRDAADKARVLNRVIRKKAHGKQTRDLMIHDFAQQRVEELVGRSRLSPGMKWLTLTTEVRGPMTIRDGAHPVFFSGENGPRIAGGATIDLRQGDIRRQVQAAIESIGNLLLPKRR